MNFTVTVGFLCFWLNTLIKTWQTLLWTAALRAASLGTPPWWTSPRETSVLPRGLLLDLVSSCGEINHFKSKGLRVTLWIDVLFQRSKLKNVLRSNLTNFIINYNFIFPRFHDNNEFLTTSGIISKLYKETYVSLNASQNCSNFGPGRRTLS